MGFAATAIDLWFGYPYLINHWADVPQIMRSRVPGYTLTPIIAAPVSYGIALLTIYIGGEIWRVEHRWTMAHLLFVTGVTWWSFFLITVQLNYAVLFMRRWGPAAAVTGEPRNKRRPPRHRPVESSR